MQVINNQEMSSYKVNFNLKADPEENQAFGDDVVEGGLEVGCFVTCGELFLAYALIISGEFAAGWLQLVHFRGTTEADR